MIRSDLVEFLSDGICEVLFVKKDGTDRLMKCTLNYDYIPEDMKPLNIFDPKKVLKNLDILKVFDTEKQGWRSFTVENVQYIKPHESI